MYQFLIRLYVYILLINLCLVACSDSKKREKNPAIEKILETVSSLEIEETISDLVAFETRFPYKKQLEVADYLSERLKVHITTTDFHE